MKVNEAIRCCNAVHDYMRRVDESERCARDLRSVANLLKQQQATIDAQAEIIEVVNISEIKTALTIFRNGTRTGLIQMKSDVDGRRYRKAIDDYLEALNKLKTAEGE